MNPALAFALQALTALPNLIQAGIDVAMMIQHTTLALKSMHEEGRDPTDSEWEALHTNTQDALARLDAASR